MKVTEDSLRDLWNNIKCSNIWIIRVPEEEEEKKRYEKFFEEIIVVNFPSMEKEIVNQVHEAYRVPYRINPRGNTPRHTNITNKDWTQRKYIKSSKGEAKSNIPRKPHMLNSWSFSRTLQARREWQDIFKVLKGKNLQPRLLYPARISFRVDGKIKSLSTKHKRIHYHQINFTTNVKGTYIVKKHKRRQKIYKINPKQLRKWQ